MMGRLLMAVLLLLIATSACSLPKVYQFHDPLTPREHLALGVSYESQGESSLAIAEYKKVIEADSDRDGIAARVFLGNVYAGLEDYQTAEQCYREALALDPTHGQALNNLASIYVKQGIKLQEAEALARAAVAQSEGDFSSKHRGVYLATLGEALLRQGRSAEALKALRLAETFSGDGRAPWLIQLYLNMADAFEQLGQAADAQQARERVYRLRGEKGA